MQIEIKINGEAAELQDVLRALLNSSTEQATTTEANSIDLRKPKTTRKAGDAIKVDATDSNSVEQVKEVAALQEAEKPAPEAIKEQPDPASAATEPQTTISFETFRAAVGAAALKNKTVVKDTLTKYGAAKTSEADPAHYTAIIEELTAIK